MTWDDKEILISGGAGYLGRNLANYICMFFKPRRVVIYSRDPHKHEAMQSWIHPYPQIRYFVGDVRDSDRLRTALRGIDLVVHAAAIKSVPACEYNPSSAIRNNILGTLRVCQEAASANVQRVVCISSDKAVDPVNFYGMTKMAAEKTAIQHNFHKPIYSAVRYGNVVKSTGSVLRKWQQLIAEDKKKPLPITDRKMTRFWVEVGDAIRLIERAIDHPPGCVVVGKHKSFKVLDLGKAMYARAHFDEIGIREGEKLHETLVGHHEMDRAIVAQDHIVLNSRSDFGVAKAEVKHGKALRDPYSSDKNEFLSIAEIRERLEGTESYVSSIPEANPADKARPSDPRRHSSGDAGVEVRSSDPGTGGGTI